MKGEGRERGAFLVELCISAKSIRQIKRFKMPGKEEEGKCVVFTS